MGLSAEHACVTITLYGRLNLRMRARIRPCGKMYLGTAGGAGVRKASLLLRHIFVRVTQKGKRAQSFCWRPVFCSWIVFLYFCDPNKVKQREMCDTSSVFSTKTPCQFKILLSTKTTQKIGQFLSASFGANFPFQDHFFHNRSSTATSQVSCLAVEISFLILNEKTTCVAVQHNKRLSFLFWFQFSVVNTRNKKVQIKSSSFCFN